jgi:hypothetical protein
MPLQITRAERHELRREALVALSGVCEDSALAIQNDDWELARDFRPRYEHLVRALDTLGWEEVSNPLRRSFGAPDRGALTHLAVTSALAAELLGRDWPPSEHRDDERGVT